MLLGVLSGGTSWVMVRHLRADARETSRLLGAVFQGLSDPRPDAVAGALLELAAQVHTAGIPMALTDTTGRVTAMDNAPPDVRQGGDPVRLRAWIAELDCVNDPIVQPGVGTIHYGAPPQARRVVFLAVLQALVFVCLAALATWAYQAEIGAARDRLWVAMARESAHQLGTPLMSLTGWIASLRENPAASPLEVADHLEADAERLERVAKRFERIGRPARREPVGLGAVAERVVSYFRPRLPTLASPVTLVLDASGPGPTTLGDGVLVEWALEALIKNAIDALSGRGGHIQVRVEAQGRVARVLVRDNGPGVSPEVRAHLFEPGVSTKPGGWGIGLALTRRIIEQQHRGRVVYRAGQAGSEFSVELPLARSP